MQKFLRTLTLLALLVVPVVGWGQTSVMIGDTTTAIDDSYLPMNSLYEYSYSQQIYTSDEIGMAGTITSITLWLKGNANLYTMPFDIYMLEVDNASFTSSTDWIPVTAADIVHSDSVTVHHTGYQPYTFDLAVPFTYSGTGNLLICFDNNTGSWKSGLNGRVNTVADGTIMAIYARRDGTDYDPLNMSGITATGTVAKRNTIVLDILPAGGAICEKPATLSVVDLSAHEVTLSWASTSAGSYQFEFKAATDTTWDIMTPDNYPGLSIIIPNLQQNTTYNARVRSVCGTEYSGYRTLTFTTPVSCPAPTALTVSGITSDEATLSWSGNASSYSVYELTPTSANLVQTVTDTFFVLTDLTAMTQYNYGVTANCDNEGSGMVTVTFNTACLAVELPYLETFDSASATRECWDYVSNNTANIGGYNGMGFVTVNGHEVIRFSSYSSASDYNQYGYSPELSVSDNATNLNVSVVYATYGANDKLNFGYITANDTVWDPTNYSTTGSSDWQTYTAIIPATTVKLAVHYYGDYAYYAWIDTVNVIEMSSDYCFAVSNVTATDATANTVTLNWTDNDNSGATYSVYQMDATGATLLASGITGTTYTVTGLTAQTGYVFGVEANCSSDNASTMATVSASTGCEGGSCNIYIYAEDGWGDGWNNAAISVMQGNVVTYSMASQNMSNTTIYDTAAISVCAGAPISFSWTSGQYDGEIFFGIANANGDVVYSASGADLDDTVFFTLDSCTTAAPTYDITIAVNDATMGTTTPAPGTYQYTMGSVVEITAIPNNGYVLAGWMATYADGQGTVESDSLLSNDPEFSNPLAFYAVNDFTITALFEVSIPDSVNECTVTTLPYTETFDAMPDCWSTVDADGDGYTWNVFEYQGVPILNSRSYDNSIGALTPDNWLISPQIALPAGGNYEVTWSARPQDVNYPAEHYGLYVSTTNTNTSSFTLLQQWTLSANDNPANPVVDLSAYAGQNIYLALRHWNCSDMYWLVVDNFTVREQMSANQVLVTVNSSNAFYGNVNGGGVYTIGDSVTVTATPSAGYMFYEWVNAAGATVSTANPYSFVATTNVNLTAMFDEAPVIANVTVAVNDSTMGSTTPAPGTYQYADTAVVTLNATANAGYHFLHWDLTLTYGGAIYNQTSTENPISFNASTLADYSPVTITAIFEEDLDCTGSTCNLAIAGEDSWGDGWNGASLVVMQNNITVANFSVEDSAAIANISVCSDYPVEFVWSSGDYDSEISFTVSTSNGTQLFTIDNASALIDNHLFATVTNPCTTPVVNFNHDSVTITFAVNDATLGTITPAPGTYQYLDSDTLFIDATANTGAHFVEWQVTYVEDGALETISISGASHGYLCSGLIDYQNLTFTAIFESDTVTTLPIECTGNTCFVTIEGEDSWGDGWNGGELLMYQHDTLIATFTVADDISFSQTYTVCSDYPVEFAWSSGSYDNEISFTVSNSNGAIFNIPDGSLLAGYDVFATVSNVCDANASVVYNIEIDSLTVTLGVNDATMGSITPAPGTYHISTLDVMTVTATPNTGYYFIGWAYSYNYEDTLYYDTAYSSALDVLDIEGSYWAEVTPVSFTALFSNEPYLGDGMQVNIAVNDATMGTTNPAPGTHYFYVDEIPSVVAIPNNGYHIAGWTLQVMHPDYGYVIDTTLMYAIDDVFSLFEDEEGPLVVTEDLVDYVWNITAIFESGEPAQMIDSLTIITEVNDATMGTITPAPGTHYYVAGDVVSLSITANQGYELSGVHVITMHPIYGTILDEVYTAAELEDVFGESLEVTEEMYGYVFHFTALFVRTNSIEDANEDNVTIYSTENTVNVRGAEGRQVVLYDVNGRLISYEAKATDNVTFRVSSTGVYLVKVGDAPARRIVVMR